MDQEKSGKREKAGDIEHPGGVEYRKNESGHAGEGERPGRPEAQVIFVGATIAVQLESNDEAEQNGQDEGQEKRGKDGHDFHRRLAHSP